MAQKVTGIIKLQIPAAKATASPPVGPALGQHGVNIAAFIKEFNARTQDQAGFKIPVVITVVSAHTDIGSRLEAGADFLNVSGAAATPEIVAEIRRDFPKVPIIATGGPTEESILRTIQAGANAITYTPPSNGVLFARIMNQHRKAL